VYVIAKGKGKDHKQYEYGVAILWWVCWQWF
jgi:hypothetical protein